ncbi:unnamed protein product [Meganyctiphanes norvegica]|uniref:Uncharacterized protein n=1 Tax=Meganyctiphanes norvegica TaxID=48144 RepID=A0AAV2RRX5_MEGNR
MFLPSNSDEQYKHYQLSYLIVNGTTWGLEVKGIEGFNRGKREASGPSKASSDEAEISILDTRDFSKKNNQSQITMPSISTSQQYLRRATYRQRYANNRKAIHSFMNRNDNGSTIGVRRNNRWSRKPLSKINSKNETNDHDTFSNRRYSSNKPTRINTFRHYDSLNEKPGTSTRNTNLSTVAQQSQALIGRSRTPDEIMRNDDDTLSVQKFRRRHNTNVHRLRHPRNYPKRTDDEQERIYSNKNISNLNFNSSKSIQITEFKNQQNSQKIHKRRHDKQRKEMNGFNPSSTDIQLPRSENKNPFAKEKKEKSPHRKSNKSPYFVTNTTIGDIKNQKKNNESYFDALNFNEKVNRSLLEEEKTKTQKIKVPNNKHSQNNEGQILKKRKRKRKRKKEQQPVNSNPR